MARGEFALTQRCRLMFAIKCTTSSREKFSRPCPWRSGQGAGKSNLRAADGTREGRKGQGSDGRRQNRVGMTGSGFGWPGAEVAGVCSFPPATSSSGQGAAPDGAPVRQPLEQRPTVSVPVIRWAPACPVDLLPVAGGLQVA